MGTRPEKLNLQFFASCPSGLEPLLSEEIKAIGGEKIAETKGGVNFSGLDETPLKLILHSRVATKVYKKLFTYFVGSEDDVYYCAHKINWREIFDVNQTFKVNTIIGQVPRKRSIFTNGQHLSLVLKDAICDRFRDEINERPSIDRERPHVQFMQYIVPEENPRSRNEEVTLLVDLCGRSLGDRGVRKLGAEAPVRENLAAGILLFAKDELMKRDFFDPMCGSGTFLLEAALIKANIPAAFSKIISAYKDGRPEQWAFQQLAYYRKDNYLQKAFRQILAEAYQLADAGFDMISREEFRIYGSDLRSDVLQTARENLGRAGILPFIHFQQKDATKVAPPTDGPLFIFANPPYGERLGANEDLEPLYHEFGENLKKNYKNAYAMILSGNMDMLKKISLRPNKRRIVFNGNIECRVVDFNLF